MPLALTSKPTMSLIHPIQLCPTPLSDCIYLRYNDNAQGSHDLYHLQTNHMITRHRVTQVPITLAIINMVHHLASIDGMPKGLKITNHTGQLLYNSTWLAGVDYDEEQFEDEDYDPNNSDKDSEDNDDDNDDDNAFNEMDPDEIAMLAGPTDQHSEDTNDELESMQDPEEVEEEQENEEEDDDAVYEGEDTNPTTVEEQTIPENARVTRSG